MIDFHNHILPNADDGSKSMEESIQMLHCAQKQGITDVVNTIHFQHPKMEGKKTDFEFVCSLKNELTTEMKKENININIHLGAEVFFNFNLLDIIDNPLTTFGNNRYMLIEFQTHQFPKGFDQHLFDLAISGITPIIAHPERYKEVQNDISIVEKLINSGCLMQIDGGSLLSHFGEKCKATSIIMLRRNMVHIIGSDSHGLGKRNFCLKEAIGEAGKYINHDISTLIGKNPRKVLLGETIDLEDMVDLKNKSFFSKLFRK